MNKYYIARMIIIAGLIGIVVIFIGIAVVSLDTDPGKAIASNLERVSPTPGGMLSPQSDIVFDLSDGYVGYLIIDDKIIPEDEMDKVESLGQYTFHPGLSKSVKEFNAGPHKAEIVYWPSGQNENEKIQRYSWSFQVTS